MELSGVYTADVWDVLHSSLSLSFDLRVSGRDGSCYCLLGMIPCGLVNGCLHFAIIYRYYIHLKCSRQRHTYSEINPEDGGNISLRNRGSHVKFKVKSCFCCNITRNLRKEWVAVEKSTGIFVLRPTDTLNGEKRSRNVCVGGSYKSGNASLTYSNSCGAGIVLCLVISNSMRYIKRVVVTKCASDLSLPLFFQTFFFTFP